MTTLHAPETHLAQVLRADRGAPDGALPLAKNLIGAGAGAALFGVGLASFSMHPMQVLASGLKMPVLLLGTALLCFPTFYLLQVSRSDDPLTLGQALRILATALAATGYTWAALSPPVLFLVATSHYYVLARCIAVVVGAAGGVVGLARFRSLCRQHWSSDPSPFERWALRPFALLFSAVGGQLAWVLRPFIGSPFMDFVWLRSLGSTPMLMLLGS